MLRNLLELMFRTALSAGSGNRSYVQNITLQETHDEIVFASHLEFFAGAVGLMFATLVFVASNFYGWWQLGRNMTMSPIEIASAYNVPLLRGHEVSANANVDMQLEKIGGRRVRYGEIVDDTSGLQKGSLGFGLIEDVQRPEKGAFYFN